RMALATGTAASMKRTADGGLHAGASTVLAGVSTGICTDTAEACATDADCAHGTCFLPPGGCLRNLGTSCFFDPTVPHDPCPPGQTCLPNPATPRPGICHADLRACETDATCPAGSFWANAGSDLRRLETPLAARVGGGLVFPSRGQCVAATGAVDGPCVSDSDCAAGAACQRAVLVATAADRHRDELPDPFSNC